MLSCESLERIRFILEVVCEETCKMVGQEPLSPRVRVFMTEEEALFHEMECGDSQQGNSSEGAIYSAVPVQGCSHKLELARVADKWWKRSLILRRLR